MISSACPTRMKRRHRHADPIRRRFSKRLSGARHPRRRSANGRSALCAYFIMGRSVNSRNRVFAAEGDGLRTRVYDPSLLSDPSLILYAPVRVLGPHTILTNGDQTDTVYEFLRRGDSFEAALRTRSFEPDAPHYTPRISALLTRHDGGFSYRLSILKSLHGDPSCCCRFFYEYDAPACGVGHFLHTYQGDGSPLPSFAGEPETVAMPDDLDQFARTLWDYLDADNRVSLFARAIDLETGAAQTRLFNKHG